MENLKKLRYETEQALAHLHEPLRIIAVHGAQGSQAPIREQAFKQLRHALKAVLTYAHAFVTKQTNNQELAEDKLVLSYCHEQGYLSKDQVEDLYHALKDISKIDHDICAKHVEVALVERLARYYKAMKTLSDYLSTNLSLH
jgi:hypothetical protein